jgi:hypothetical protein
MCDANRPAAQLVFKDAFKSPTLPHELTHVLRSAAKEMKTRKALDVTHLQCPVRCLSLAEALQWLLVRQRVLTRINPTSWRHREVQTFLETIDG